MFWLGKSIQSETETDKKIGLSPIEYIVMAHLRSRELRNSKTDEIVGQYGYELIQELNTLFAGSWEAKSGTIYPILTKLEKDKNYLSGDEKKSPLGPVKKVYTLTDEGRKLIDAIIHENFKSDIDFVLHYVELLTPFIMKIQQLEGNEESFEYLMQIPTKAIALAMERVMTEVDQELKNKKLLSLKANLEKILRNIELGLK